MCREAKVPMQEALLRQLREDVQAQLPGLLGTTQGRRNAH